MTILNLLLSYKDARYTIYEYKILLDRLFRNRNILNKWQCSSGRDC